MFILKIILGLKALNSDRNAVIGAPDCRFMERSRGEANLREWDPSGAE